ncbi:MAG: DUF2231 domain-containing protein [Deltaproteobacteria bacterium]|nr:DUF2231 domain-containing protein [Deltaproteobacteria bacterium]
MEPATPLLTWPTVLWWLPPLHPLFVHFPAAFLFGAGGIAGWQLVRRSFAPSRTLTWLLDAGAVTALAAVGSGLYFESSIPHRHDGVIHTVMEWHETLGIVTAIVAVLLTIGRRCADRAANTRWTRVLLWGTVALMLLVGITGHFGALLVHRFSIAVPVPVHMHP